MRMLTVTTMTRYHTKAYVFHMRTCLRFKIRFLNLSHIASWGWIIIHHAGTVLCIVGRLAACLASAH